MGLKLSDLNPGDVEPVSAPHGAKLRLSDLHPDDVQALQSPDSGVLDAAVRGPLQGFTFGWGDELSGLEGAVANKLGSAGVDPVRSTHPSVQAKIDAQTPPERSFRSLYDENRDEQRGLNDAAREAHPWLYGAGNIAGAIANPISSVATGLGGAAAVGGTLGLGNSNADLTEGDIKGAAIDTGIGAGTGAAAYGAAKLAEPYLKRAGDYASSKLQSLSEGVRGKAENLAETATGATGRQAEKYTPGTGRFLLDKKIVNPLSSAKDIAENASQALDQSGEDISNILNNKLKDTTVDRNRVIQFIQDKIDSLKGNEGENNLVGALRKNQSDIAAEIQPGLTEETANSSVPISQSEKIKRSFDRNAKWDSNTDASTRLAARVAANGYRNAGVDAAMEADPVVGQQFQDAMRAYQVLSPVEEAAA